jgi:WD40-like Beta Propeller Repeat
MPNPVIQQKTRRQIMHKTRFWHCIALAMVLGGISGMAQGLPDGPYFGQKPPGLTPELFTPGFTAFTPDQQECFLEKDGVIHYLKVVDGHWKGPFVASFLGNDAKGSGPKIGPDGKILSFNVNGKFWISRRNGTNWSAAEKLPDQINSEQYACTIAFLKDGSAYFASQRPGTKGACDIFFSKFKNGRYEEPVNMDVFNTPGSECMVCVSPKEDYIMFTGFNRSDGFGSADMYISFLAKDGSWTVPQHLGHEFNTADGEGPVSFSPDGKHLFFGRSPVTGRVVYWVDVKALEKYRPDAKEK